MTLPASGPISLTQVMAELRTSNPGRAFPISLGDSDVRALAGVPSGPISLSNLLGKQSIPTLSGSSSDGNSNFNTSGGAGTASSVASAQGIGGSGNYSYAWTVTGNPSNVTIGATNQSTIIASRTYQKLSTGEFHVTFNCTITDNVYGTTFLIQNITANAYWDSNQ